MSPRIIQIPLSGGDRKAQAKGIRQAHGLHDSYYKDSLAIRSAAEVEIRRADETRMSGLERDHVGRRTGHAARRAAGGTDDRQGPQR